MSRRNLLVSILCFLVCSLVSQNETIKLWPGGIPYSNDLQEEIYENPKIGRVVQKVHEPEISVFHAPDNIATGTGVLICPGGGYFLLAWDWEGVQIAKWLNSIGISAFVLKYRLPHWETDEARSRVALQDAQRAMKVIRMNAGPWGLDPNKIGVMGFSAGGHLASTLSTRWDKGLNDSMSEVEHYSCRPDFSILMYPVISMMSEVTHSGSRDNLIGSDATPKMIHYYSNEMHVNTETPPTILIHASDDQGVVPQNSLLYYQSLLKNGVPASLHLFENGGHGFGFAESNQSASLWPIILETWLNNAGWMKKRYKVLIIDGQSDHDEWMLISEKMRNLLEKTDQFIVDIQRAPQLSDGISSFQPSFDHFDAVVLNYNGAEFSRNAKHALETFVDDGGGLIITHGSNAAFPNWEAFNTMRGLGNLPVVPGKQIVHLSETGELTWQESLSSESHENYNQEFEIQTIQKEHPIVKGLSSKWIQSKDVLRNGFSGPAKNLSILAMGYSDPDNGGSGRNEPVLMTVNYGNGRIFQTTLGHNVESMNSPGFQTTFIRGVEWSITGKVSNYTLYSNDTKKKSGKSQSD